MMLVHPILQKLLIVGKIDPIAITQKRTKIERWTKIENKSLKKDKNGEILKIDENLQLGETRILWQIYRIARQSSRFKN